MSRIISALITLLLAFSCSKLPEAETITKHPDIFPSYSDITLPCNIAPLNFIIKNPGSNFKVHIYGKNGVNINLSSNNGEIKIPIKRWKKLLKNNINEKIIYDFYIKKDDKWLKFLPIINFVSSDSIEPYIAYRKIGAGYILWNEMGIYQRCIEDFKETPVITNELTGKNCINCHTFNNYNPSQMVFHMRQVVNGTLIINGNEKEFINTGTNYTMSAGVYPSWHPSGKFIAFSVNKIFQLFPSEVGKNVVVEDKASDIALLDVDSNIITTSPKISTNWLENLPTWSPDGKYMYYISGEKIGEEYEKTMYSLLRIPFYTESKTWGDADTILSTQKTRKSITHPRVSPDGRFVVFCMADNGYFTVHNKKSDIYLLNLENMQYSKLPVNSNDVESTPSWSGNGRWLMFISKRTDGIYSYPWFCHVDENGNAGNPFVLPQKTAGFFESNFKNFNKPEFIKGKVTITQKDIYNLTRDEAEPVLFDKKVDINGLSGATRINPGEPDNGYYNYQ